MKSRRTTSVELFFCDVFSFQLKTNEEGGGLWCLGNFVGIRDNKWLITNIIIVSFFK